MTIKSLSVHRALAFCLLGFSYSALAEDTLRLNCDSVPTIRMEGSRFFSVGEGKTLSRAIEEAQQQLAQMLNTRLSASCSDSETTQAAEQHCTLNSFSSNRFDHTPVLAVKQCNEKVKALIVYDKRPLQERLANTFPWLEEDRADKTLPFTRLVRWLRNGSLEFNFDVKQQLWRAQSKGASLFISQQELWENLSWEACSRHEQFHLLNWGEPTQQGRSNETVELFIHAPNSNTHMSLLEMNAYGAVVHLANELELTSQGGLVNQQLQLKLLDGEVRSMFVYLVIFSPRIFTYHLPQEVLHPAMNLSQLLQAFKLQQDSVICTWPMTVHQ